MKWARRSFQLPGGDQWPQVGGGAGCLPGYLQLGSTGLQERLPDDQKKREPRPFAMASQLRLWFLLNGAVVGVAMSTQRDGKRVWSAIGVCSVLSCLEDCVCRRVRVCFCGDLLIKKE